MRSRSCGIALVLALGLASSAAAQTAHVPSQYSTIQAAIDAGATTVYVSGDVYPEILDVQHDLTLLPDPPADARQPYPYPRINGLNIVHNGATPAVVYVRGFRIATQVNQTNAAMNPGITTLEGCRLDGGFNTGMSNPLGETIRIRNCVVQGNVFVYAYYTDVTGNMVMGGTLTVHSNGGTRL